MQQKKPKMLTIAVLTLAGCTVWATMLTCFLYTVDFTAQVASRSTGMFCVIAFCFPVKQTSAAR